MPVISNVPINGRAVIGLLAAAQVDVSKAWDVRIAVGAVDFAPGPDFDIEADQPIMMQQFASFAAGGGGGGPYGPVELHLGAGEDVYVVNTSTYATLVSVIFQEKDV